MMVPLQSGSKLKSVRRAAVLLGGHIQLAWALGTKDGARLNFCTNTYTQAHAHTGAHEYTHMRSHVLPQAHTHLHVYIHTHTQTHTEFLKLPTNSYPLVKL